MVENQLRLFCDFQVILKKERCFCLFIGTFEHNMDSKNRVFIPAKFREELGESFYYKLYASQKYPSIQLYSKEEFKRQFEDPAEGITDLAKKRLQLAKIYMGTDEANIDNQGRISIGSMIAKKAGLERSCIFVGFGSYVEVMCPKAYDDYLESLCRSNSADEIAVEKEADIYRQLMSEGKFLDVSEEEIG